MKTDCKMKNDCKNNQSREDEQKKKAPETSFAKDHTHTSLAPSYESMDDRKITPDPNLVFGKRFEVIPFDPDAMPRDEFYDYFSWEKCYVMIDLKSFYASVECIERGIHPLKANLVVADNLRTEKTICLAVTPSLKSLGVSGRPRLFEVIQKVKEINDARAQEIRQPLCGSSTDGPRLASDPTLAVDYIVARPQMARYMEVSARIYEIYLRYVAPEDILAYSVDEVFIDVTKYLSVHKMTPDNLARTMIYDVLSETGITATAGVAPNLFLCKVAMDVKAKHMQADANGVRIASLDDRSFRETMWTHEPITDFWRIGRGTADRLRLMGIYTLGDIALCSVQNEDRLYQEFGINAELLIDHAWGWEPCTLADVKAYLPASNSINSGQVLQDPYETSKAKLIVREMIDLLSMDLVEKGVLTDQIVLHIGYDVENLTDPKRFACYLGPIEVDVYGRKIPGHSQGTANLNGHTSSTNEMTDAVMELFDRIVRPGLTIRRLNLSANHILPENQSVAEAPQEPADLFFDPYVFERANMEKRKEKAIQSALLVIRKKYGKNAILKGMNYEEGATTIARNRQIGGHNAE